MSTLTLEQLQAAETRLVTAMGDPTRAVFYDDFKRENRPISEIQDALAAIRSEIRRLNEAITPTPPRPRRILLRHKDSY